MHTPRRIVSLALLCSLLAAARVSSAQPTAGQLAIAETLFREGRQLMAEGRFHDACPKLAESQRIDAQVGTLINLAACHDGEGKTASAWAEYNDAAAQAVRAGRADHESVARRKGADVQARLSRVVMIAARPIDGLVVTFDGAQLGNGVLGTPLPIDPGLHAIKAEAAGRLAWSITIDVRPGPATQTVTLPDLAPASAGEPSFPDPSASPRRVRPLAWVTGGVALTGLGVGAYFGLRAFAKNDEASIACRKNICSAAGLELDHEGRTAATVSTVAFAIGAASALATVGLLVFRGSGGPAPQIALSPLGVDVRGAW
ncbi:MAG: hypothetical protein ABJE95_04945 [Byssovorax sp.]